MVLNSLSHRPPRHHHCLLRHSSTRPSSTHSWSFTHPFHSTWLHSKALFDLCKESPTHLRIHHCWRFPMPTTVSTFVTAITAAVAIHHLLFHRHWCCILSDAPPTSLNVTHMALGLHFHGQCGHSCPITITVVDTIRTPTPLGTVEAVSTSLFNAAWCLTPFFASNMACPTLLPHHWHNCRPHAACPPPVSTQAHVYISVVN